MSTATVGVTTKTLIRLSGVSYRQADYWTRCGYLQHLDFAGSGYVRRHPASEVAVAAGLRQLLDAGAKGGAVAEAAVQLRGLPAGYSGPVLLDRDGRRTDDLRAARWVVQVGTPQGDPRHAEAV